jgi:hypothetical protein
VSTIAPDEEPGLHWPDYDEVVRLYDNLRRLERSAPGGSVSRREIEALRVCHQTRKTGS